MVNEHWLYWKSAAALAPNNRAGLSSEVSKPDIHFPL